MPKLQQKRQSDTASVSPRHAVGTCVAGLWLEGGVPTLDRCFGLLSRLVAPPMQAPDTTEYVYKAYRISKAGVVTQKIYQAQPAGSTGGRFVVSLVKLPFQALWLFLPALSLWKGHSSGRLHRLWLCILMMATGFLGWMLVVRGSFSPDDPSFRPGNQLSEITTHSEALWRNTFACLQQRFLWRTLEELLRVLCWCDCFVVLGGRVSVVERRMFVQGRYFLPIAAVSSSCHWQAGCPTRSRLLAASLFCGWHGPCTCH